MHRFRAKSAFVAMTAFARLTGIAPVSVWSGSSRPRSGSTVPEPGYGGSFDTQFARGKDKVAALRLLRLSASSSPRSEPTSTPPPPRSLPPTGPTGSPLT